MPVCFKLFSKDNQEKAISLTLIDERICREVLNVEPHPKWYGGTVFNWFDTIGFMIASSSDMYLGSAALREHYSKSEMWAEEWPMIEKILDFLEANYTSTSFYQSSSRD